MTIERILELIEENGGAVEHNDLKRAIFEDGGAPDHRTFGRILKSRKVSREVVKLEDGSRTVMYRKAE